MSACSPSHHLPGVHRSTTTSRTSCARKSFCCPPETPRRTSTSTSLAGRLISAGMAVYDTMVLAPCDIATYAMGMARLDGRVPARGGHQGKRYALPHARILMHPAARRHHRRRRRLAIQAEQFASSRRRCSASSGVHRADPRAHRSDSDATLVHRAGGSRVRLRRPHHHQRQPHRSGPTAGLDK